jgi:hypothetical protein
MNKRQVHMFELVYNSGASWIFESFIAAHKHWNLSSLKYRHISVLM